MEIKVISRSGKDLGTFVVTEDIKIKEFKTKFHEKRNLYIDKQWYPSRQRFCVNSTTGPAIGNDSEPLIKYLGKDRVLCFKDLGMQLGWRLVYMIEYAGPLFILPLLYYLPSPIYGLISDKTPTQKATFLMMIGHFLKRELESMFLHRFSSDTMPAKNIIINCLYYWVFNGLFVGYFLFSPRYTDPKWSSTVFYSLIGSFTVAEIMNFFCHLHLRNLRPSGTKVRGIPKGYGFDLVSCANYFWEIVAWASFAGLSKCLPAYIFLSASLIILTNWSKVRHRKYIKEFDGKEGRTAYPKSRKALIPFII